MLKQSLKLGHSQSRRRRDHTGRKFPDHPSRSGWFLDLLQEQFPLLFRDTAESLPIPNQIRLFETEPLVSIHRFTPFSMPIPPHRTESNKLRPVRISGKGLPVL